MPKFRVYIMAQAKIIVEAETWNDAERIAFARWDSSKATPAIDTGDDVPNDTPEGENYSPPEGWSTPDNILPGR
jgi:hypothetical protein